MRRPKQAFTESEEAVHALLQLTFFTLSNGLVLLVQVLGLVTPDVIPSINGVNNVAKNASPFSSQQLFQFGKNGTWIENVAARSNGDLLFTVLQPAPQLYTLAGVGSTDPQATLLYEFPNMTGLLGITEAFPDTFVVAGGKFTGTASPVLGTFSLWKPSFAKLLDLPDHVYPNGLTSVPGKPGVILVADSIGSLLRVDVTSNQTDTVAAVPEMAPVPGWPFLIGINGIKIYDGYVYWTNSFAATMYRMAIDADGFAVVTPSTSPSSSDSTPTMTTDAIAGPTFTPKVEQDSSTDSANVTVETVVYMPITFMDDFVIADDGVLWITTNPNNTVVAFDPATGKSAVAAGDQNQAVMAGANAAVFGRTDADSQTLYVVTAGGLNSPVNGTFIEPAKIVAMDASTTFSPISRSLLLIFALLLLPGELILSFAFIFILSHRMSHLTTARKLTFNDSILNNYILTKFTRNDLTMVVMEWSPLPDFSLAGALAVLLTLGMIDKTKETVLGYTLLLFIFNLYALKIALTVINEAYYPGNANAEYSSAPADFPTHVEINQEYDQGFNWERVWTQLSELTVLMARSRQFELNAEDRGGHIYVEGTTEQIKALAKVMRLIGREHDYTAAFVDFIDIEPSNEWIKVVEDFLSPRPTSYAELILTCHECLNKSTVDCLQGAQLTEVFGYNQRVEQIMRIIQQEESEWRVELLTAIQTMVNLATTPKLREDLYLTVTARRNGLQPMDRAIQFVKDLTPDAVKLLRHKADIKVVPAFLVPVLDVAEAVVDPNCFDCVMANTGRLLRELRNLTIQCFVKLRQKMHEADAGVKFVQGNVTHNWRLLVGSPGWNRSTFMQQLVSRSGFEPTLALDVVEGLHLAFLEAIHIAEPSPDHVPDVVQDLSYVDLVKLNNLILRQPNVQGFEGEIASLWAETAGAHDDGQGRAPPPFSSNRQAPPPFTA
ncbi:hypothetical protein PG994_002265 [Apiospora phragmitis]|uniref:Uncharacterized protein n=1 Tax=Apiospora phragmitis TaxID=2905665 RepID=A0ABR1WVV8_9PEZI